MRPNRTLKRILPLILFFIASACVNFSVGAKPILVNAQDNTNEDEIEFIRIFDNDEFGITNPGGLAFSNKTGDFHIAEAGSASLALATDIDLIRVRPSGRRYSNTRIAAALKDPINMTYDGKANRLLIYQPDTQRLLEIKERTNGNLNPNSIRRYNFQHLGIQEPQGLTVDPSTGALYILDTAVPEIIQVRPNDRGHFNRPTVTHIPINSANILTPRGIAYDPVNKTFYIMDSTQQKLVEVTRTGQLVNSRNLPPEIKVTDRLGMVFAPSGDPTDDPSIFSLYIVDAVLASSIPPALSSKKIEQMSIENVSAAPSSSGQVIELSLLAPAALVENILVSPITLVRTTQTWQYSPPSPDPSGIAFLSNSNSLIISDGEVNEIPALFTGDNVFETTLSGSLIGTFTTLPFSKEPTGIAFNPTNNHLFISDDTGLRSVYELNPGPDGLYDTSDDIITSVLMSDVGSDDPEGIAFDPLNNHLIVVDGIGEEIYVFDSGANGVFDGVSPTGDDVLVRNFDATALGLNDPEGVEFNPDNGHFYILSDEVIAETLADGTLIRYIDISPLNAINPAGLAYAPSSFNPSERSLYIVDRAIDNNNDPNENDGLLYEVSIPVNASPAVNAGVDQTVSIGSGVILDGTVTDDGLPNPPSMVTTTWSLISGPRTVTFANAGTEDTTAAFSATGVYVLRLTADDSELTASDELTVTFTLNQYLLTTATDGTGSGTVAHNPTGGTYEHGTEVTVTPSPNAGSTFTSWAGACNGTGACVITMDEAKSVTATFTLGTNTLTVLKDGKGSVSSSPAGIDCGEICAQVYDYGMVVTLTAIAESGATFTGWSGDCNGTGACVITIDEAKSVTATFTLNQYLLTTAMDGTGSGMLALSPVGGTYEHGTEVAITPSADVGSTFAGWAGACTGSGACVITMDEAKSVTATFTLNQYLLTTATDGTGSGTLALNPTGGTYDHGTDVTVTPLPSAGSTFTGWSGACTGTDSCVITMDEAKTVTATFTVYTIFLPIIIK